MLTEFLGLFTRLVVALETLAGNGAPLLPTAGNAAADDKPAAGKKAAGKKAAPAIDYTLLRDKAKALVTTCAENGHADAVKKAIQKTGAARLSEVPDESLEDLIPSLEAIADL